MAIDTRQAIRETRQRGQAAVIPARYSPSWWDSDRSKPSILRQQEYRWKPRMCVIHDHEGMRQFIAFGDQEGMAKALDEILGPIVTAAH